MAIVIHNHMRKRKRVTRDSEKELIKQQLKAANEWARDVARTRGYTVHPKLAKQK